MLLTSPDDSIAATEQLQQRGWIAHTARQTLSALAELCLLERGIELRRSRGLAPAEQLALVVVESAYWSDLPGLLAAARRYVPSAALWTIRDGQLMPLAAANPPPRKSLAPTEGAEAALNDRPRASYKQEMPPPSVTGDEIGMLLDDAGPDQ